MIRPFSLRVLLCILLFACLPVAAQTLPADKIEKIEKEITAVMSQQNIPGLSVAVVTDQKLRWSNGYGLADLENYVPAKAATSPIVFAVVSRSASVRKCAPIATTNGAV